MYRTLDKNYIIRKIQKEKCIYVKIIQKYWIFTERYWFNNIRSPCRYLLNKQKALNFIFSYAKLSGIWLVDMVINAWPITLTCNSRIFTCSSRISYHQVLMLKSCSYWKDLHCMPTHQHNQHDFYWCSTYSGILLGCSIHRKAPRLAHNTWFELYKGTLLEKRNKAIHR